MNEVPSQLTHDSVLDSFYNTRSHCVDRTPPPSPAGFSLHFHRYCPSFREAPYSCARTRCSFSRIRRAIRFRMNARKHKSRVYHRRVGKHRRQETSAAVRARQSTEVRRKRRCANDAHSGAMNFARKRARSRSDERGRPAAVQNCCKSSKLIRRLRFPVRWVPPVFATRPLIHPLSSIQYSIFFVQPCSPRHLAPLSIRIPSTYLPPFLPTHRPSRRAEFRWILSLQVYFFSRFLACSLGSIRRRHVAPEQGRRWDLVHRSARFFSLLSIRHSSNYFPPPILFPGSLFFSTCPTVVFHFFIGRARDFSNFGDRPRVIVSHGTHPQAGSGTRKMHRKTCVKPRK